MRLARTASGIRLQAWEDRFAYRPPQDLAYMREHNSPELMLEYMETAAETGNFQAVTAIISDPEFGAAVSIAWGANDVSGNAFERRMKLLRGRHVYAWLAQLDTIPSYQGQGIGAAVVHAWLGEFRDDQAPTAYVFDENEITLDWFQTRLGFTPSPATPTPRPVFGPRALTTDQWRLQAESVEYVRKRIAERYDLSIVDDIKR